MPDALARDPQDLERLLVARQHAGDVEGMVALYEPQAVVDCGEGRVLQGKEAIRAYFAGVVATGRKFAVGEQRVLGLDPGTVIGGDLALTSTRLPDGTVTAESLPRTPIREPAPDHDPGSPAARPTAPGSGSSTSFPTRSGRPGNRASSAPRWPRLSLVAGRA